MKKEFSFLFVVIASVFFIASISAVTQVYLPNSNTNITGTFAFSCNTTMPNVINMSVWTNLTGTQTQFIVNISNSSASQTSFNQSKATSSLTDGLNYQVWCTAFNVTGSQENSSMATGITFDNTNPQCSLSVEKQTIPVKGNQRLTWSNTDALSLLNTTVMVDGPGKQTNKTYSTATDGGAVLTSTDTPYVGSWLVTIVGYDTAGNTCSASTTFKSYLPESTSTGAQSPQNNQTQGIVIIVILLILAYLLLKKK